MINIENIRELILSSLLSANEMGNIDLSVIMNSGITKDWFENEAHIATFEAMSVYYGSDKPFDDSVIMPYLKKSGIAYAEEFMLNLMAQKQVPQNILLEHITSLKEVYQKKMLQNLHAEMQGMLVDESLSSDAITQMIQNQIDGYAALNKTSSTKRLSEVRKMRKLQPPAVRIETGVPFIDTVLTDKHGEKGIRNEGLFFISGLKQSGKTFVLTRIIENVSKEHNVMFGSLEFGQDMYDENVEEQQGEKHFDGNIDNIFMFDDIYDVSAIIAEIKLQHKLHGLKLVALDSMMRMTNNNPDLKTDERRLSELFSKLGKLSKEIKVPIIVIVQSSKEDLKSSMVSVKGSMNADHEAYVWFHLTKPKQKNNEDSELRVVTWVKNKDTHKHPIQHLVFVPQTSDFYRVELDDNGYPAKPLDKFRRPPAQAIETVYEDIPKEMEEQSTLVDMPQF